MLLETSDIIKKVRQIEIKTRGLTNQIFSGQYHSAFRGKGMTFSEVREYQYGDDIRSIDWNVTARFNHPYIKIFDEERELTVMLLIDVSGSNEFGTQKQFKEELMTEVAAVLAFSAIQNNDKVGVIFFSDRIEKFIPPKKGTTHILRIIRELIDFKPQSQKTDISEALKFLNNVLKKRSVAFVLSDFIDRNFYDAMKRSARKHDLIALRIFDPSESQLPRLGMVQMYNKEEGKSIWVDTSGEAARKHYQNWWKETEKYIQSAFTRCGVDNATLQTDRDYIKPLTNLFRTRGSRR
ncbi:MAG: DUF58 domain-containing protein [Bacteroidales bacterium]|jgi:uncharacterized protein (DUF58 family)|nr:DUF58 domain-containing protein [Bacteroidales bacterium]